MEKETWISIARAAQLLGVSTRTVRGYTDEGKLPDIRSAGNRRIFRLDQVQALRSIRTSTRRDGVVIYGRVSSRRQQSEGDLDRQLERLREAAGDRLVAEFTDVASGLSDKRGGLRRALTEVTRGEAKVLMVEHRDRLARFGTRIIEHQLGLVGVDLVVLNEQDTTADPAQEMVEDLLAIVASFAGRLYGIRSKKARELQRSVAEHVGHPEGEVDS